MSNYKKPKNTVLTKDEVAALKKLVLEKDDWVNLTTTNLLLLKPICDIDIREEVKNRFIPEKSKPRRKKSSHT